MGNSEVFIREPANGCLEPEITIAVPALNEEITIGEFIDWCHQGIAAAGVASEILIIDSGTDRTAEIALAKGARVLKTPRRGLGRAYIDAIPFIRGKYVILGDCDCTYDFRELRPFVEKLRAGYEFVMGSRFLGTIDPGAMPPLHRYLGTPVTTAVLNFIYGSRFSDIHCGMRALTKQALQAMDLRSQSWEYASEMVLKSVHHGLKTTEVPIHFLKDREGRFSHHRREGWFSPWKAAWINLKAMFVYGADFFLFKPGMALLFLGLLLTLPLSFGPLTIGRVQFSLYWMLLGLSLSTLGLQCVYMGILAQVFFDYRGSVLSRWLRLFSYNRTILISSVTFAIGFALDSLLIRRYVENGLKLTGLIYPENYLAVTGLLMMIFGFMSFTFTLLLHACSHLDWRRTELASP